MEKEKKAFGLPITYVMFIYEIRRKELKELEELDGQAVSALGVRSRKLSTGLNGQS
jgi:hypothetical protein